ncbi:hypothetical protein B7463_g5141, partial [Scytalidium lignicola]
MQEDGGKKLSLEGLKGPGIMWVNAKITKPEDLSRGIFTQWYDQVHIPDVVGVDGIVAGWRYESEEQDDEKPYLAIYGIPELEIIQKNIDFKSVPQHHPMLPGGQSIYLYAEFDTRFYKRVRVQEKENAGEGETLKPTFSIVYLTDPFLRSLLNSAVSGDRSCCWDSRRFR